MQPIPTPQVLDPDRILGNDRGQLTADHQTRAQLLEHALNETCSYAQQLWHDLDAIRGYLLDSLPPDPRTPGLQPTASASPTGPDDHTGWENWIAAYATVTSVLCGPHGDSGYGIGDARLQANVRRTAPVLGIHTDRPGVGMQAHQQPTHQDDTQPYTPSPQSDRSRAARAIATIALMLLALRRLRLRRRSPT